MKNSLLVFLFLVTAIRGYSQCTLSVNLSSSGPAICSGSSVVLTATPSAGTAPYTYIWSDGETTSSISVNKAGTYSVTVTDKTAGCAGVKQSITITSAAVPNAPTVNNVVACPNSPATLTATAPGGTYQWYDAPTGGNFLASGATYVTPPINSPTIFYVDATVNGCTSARSAVTVTVTGIPPTANATVCSGDVATLLAAGGGTYAWYASAGGGTVLSTNSNFVTPPLVATTVYYVVVTSPNGCVSAPKAVTAFVTPPPQAPTGAGATICAGSVASLHATSASGGTIDWFTAPTGGTSLISSPDYTTPALNATTTYYVQTTVGTCVSPRSPVIVTVNPIPTKPVVPPVTICSGSVATLTPTGPGGTYTWYNAAVGGIQLAVGPSYTTPALSSSTTYYVEVSNGGCSSGRAAVNVTVTQPPPSPSASGAVICSGSTVTLTATAPGGVYEWYDAAVGGNLLVTNAAFTTPVLSATTTYYVQTTVAGCTSARTPVVVTIPAAPAAPTAPGAAICSGSVATLTASGSTGSYQWYDAAVGGTLLITGSTYVTPSLVSNTTYYVQSISSIGCPSARTAVTVTINTPPAGPTLTGVPPVCPGSHATLTATAAGTVSWYSTATGGVPLATGNTFTTTALGATTTFYADQTTGTCTSARTSVTVSVISVASPQFSYSAGTFCITGVNPTPVINNPAGGTFSASPAGLVFVSTTTGQINLAASAPGSYTISFAGLGPCPTVGGALITLSTSPSAQFSYAGPFCQDVTSAIPTFPAGSSAGIFTAPAGLFIVNPSTGEINPSKSTNGTYTVTNTIPASGLCAASTFTASVTIDQSVIVAAGPNQTIPAGATATLAGAISGGATTGTWSGGTGSFSNPNALNAVYTPGIGETSATLTLTSADPAGPCGPKSDKVIITINSPAAPTAGGTTICSGTPAILFATAPGGVYTWYNAPTGGTLLFTGATFTTPNLTTNTTYYVQTTVAGATSPRTAVIVTVSPVPATPLPTGAIICSGQTATLTASGSTGVYEWYDAPVGGNLLSTNPSYTTTFLTTNTSYYVDALGNSCSSARVKVDVIVNPIPDITSAPAANICSGTALNYTITSSTPGATFTWSRAAIANISNAAVSNQNSSSITETLINTGTTAVNVTYVITPTGSGCPGIPFNFVVTVNPLPTITSAAAVPVCDGTPLNYTITLSQPGPVFSWSRAAVAGISNAPVSGQGAATILESLFNTTNAPIDVTYVITYQTASCTGLTFNLVVTVSPSVSITSSATGSACSGVPQNYVITSNAAGTTYVWSRNPVAGVSNPGVGNQTSSPITETLVNTGTTPVSDPYFITPMLNGCPGPIFTYTVIVYPAVPTPVANSNSPVCSGTTINLQSPIIPNAIYNWSGPNGFSAVGQNPSIPNVTVANSGTYNLFITINGCSSATVSVPVVVNPPPVVDAGPPLIECTNVVSVQLAGSVVSATGTGLWSTNGTGTFSPAANVLNAQYLPSAADIAAGSVTLTLASTSPDNCNVVTSNMVITFKAPIVTSSVSGSTCSGTALNYTITSDFPTATFTWSRAAVANISNPAVSGQISGTIAETLINTGTTPVSVIYIITPLANGCPGTPSTYTVTVNPIPAVPVVTANTPVCINSTINLQTPTVSGAAYTWTGPNGFTSPLQNPTIPGATAADAGTYSLTVMVNGCSSTAGTVNVVVDPLPVSNAGNPQVVCITATSVTLAGTETGGTPTGSWSTSGTGTFSSPTALNAQYFPSAADIASGLVTLTLSSTSADNCAISTSTTTITFKAPSITSAAKGSICNATSQDYTITSDAATATFTWSRAAVAGISNGAVSGQTSGTITESLNNSGSTPIDVIYLITPIDNGCQGNPFTYTVTVNPTPLTPTATANSPVCVNSTIQLQTPTVSGAAYSWTGPNGFTSPLQNPTISSATAADAGTYSVSVMVNGCSSANGTVNLVVDPLPVSNAGPDQTVCPSFTTINLAGTETGGTPTGSWSTSGTGTFSSPTALNAQYFASAADISSGSVKLTLSSTSADNCAISTSTMTVKFQLLPAVTAGPDQSICSQSTATLNGQVIIGGGVVWSSSGTGTFNPSPNQLNATYVPSAADVKSGSVVLTLTANGAGQCYIPSDNLTLKLIPPPAISAGNTIFILKGHTFTLSPTSSDPDVTYSWSPNLDISSTNIENPEITGNVDRTYTLTVTDSRGCQSTATVNVVVSPLIVIPNTFTPNGDGVNDQWNIQGLTAYQQATIDVFDRNGQKIFHSVGYGTAWDGTFKGQQVPYGVYYYIIDPKTDGLKVLSGSITVIR